MQSNPQFTIFELQHPSHAVPELHKIRRDPNLETVKGSARKLNS